MGESARDHQQAIPTLLRLTEATEVQRRASAANALGGVARGIDEAIEPLSKLTYDTAPDEEGYGGHFVVGCAMSALGNLGRQPKRIVPRLIEMFDTFNEFDSDMSYGGNHVRLCDALQGFGSAATAAMPKMIRLLKSDLPKSPDEWYHDGLLDLLGSLGSGAEEAIPVLEKFDAAWFEYCHKEELRWDEEDLLGDEPEEESAYQKTIQRIRVERN